MTPRSHTARILTFFLTALVIGSIIASPAAARRFDDAGDAQSFKRPNPNAPLNTALPTITGNPVVGASLTASPGSWSGTTPSFSYNWARCASGACSSISGATSASYVLTNADVGVNISVVVTAQSTHGSATAASAQVGPVAPAPAAPTIDTGGGSGSSGGGGGSSATIAPPAATSAPTTSGSATQGATLTASTGGWSGSPTGYAYQWLRCDSTGGSCSPFTTGNGLPTYTLTVLDVGARMRVTVTATNDGGSAAATSAASGIVAPPPAAPPAPTVSISAPAPGSTVSGSIPFTATVANGTPTQVTFTIDGGASFTEYSAPYVYNGDGKTLDTTTLSNATHTLAARASFSDGSSVSSSEVVTVQNTATAPAPTPPPTGATGDGVMRFGTSYAWGSNYSRYDYLLVGFGDVDAAAATTAKSLVYKGGVDVTDTTNTDLGMNISGVGYKQALANGWLLKDASGNYIKPASGDFHWFGDIGDPNFQKAWVDNVSAFLLNHHADGVFIDNVLCSFGGLSAGVLPAKYPTDASWANAQAAFLAYVGPAMHAKGLYVAVNAYCYGPDSGTANDAWWTRIAPYVDAEMTEYFEQNPNNTSQLFFNAPTTSWMGNWLGKLDVIKAAQSAGKAALALTYGSGSNTAAMTYGRASFLLVWNGTSGAYIYNPTDSTDPWNPAWTTAIGAPTGAMTQVGGSYVRDYSGGYVVVNPSQSTVTVPLPAGLKTLSGAAAGSSVTLATTTAAIFTK
jgi:hypothetical protein